MLPTVNGWNTASSAASALGGTPSATCLAYIMETAGECSRSISGSDRSDSGKAFSKITGQGEKELKIVLDLLRN